MRELESEGVDCSGAIVDPAICSPFNLAVYAGECRRRVGGFLLPNSLAALSVKDIDEFSRRVKPGDYAMIEIGEIPLEICRSFAEICQRQGARVVVDVDLDPIVQSKGSPADVAAILSAASPSARSPRPCSMPRRHRSSSRSTARPPRPW